MERGVASLGSALTAVKRTGLGRLPLQVSNHDLALPTPTCPTTLSSLDAVTVALHANACVPLLRILTSQTVLTIAHDVLSGLVFLHGKRIVHYDLKPSNVRDCYGRASTYPLTMCRGSSSVSTSTPEIPVRGLMIQILVFGQPDGSAVFKLCDLGERCAACICLVTTPSFHRATCVTRVNVGSLQAQLTPRELFDESEAWRLPLPCTTPQTAK